MIDVREYTDEDLEKVNEILKEAFSVTKSNFTGNCFHEIVACYDGVVCGYLLLTEILDPVKNRKYYLVDYVCVSSKYQNCGVGKKLINYAYDFACDRDISYLQLTCGRYRVAAHKLYDNCGFVKRDSDIFRKEIL